MVAGLCNLGVLDKANVDVTALMTPPTMPPVSTEFTIQSPESALQYAQRWASRPPSQKPSAGALAGPMVKFSGGVAAPGTDYVLFFEQVGTSEALMWAAPGSGPGAVPSAGEAGSTPSSASGCAATAVRRCRSTASRY
ncbi:hypothetical protein LV779_14825 [Streptomyces thinghirensis]|nr:hypothetical protein [Streptomyces thinghirensis]